MVEGDGLENRCRATYREFESHPLRQRFHYPQIYAQGGHSIFALRLRRTRSHRPPRLLPLDFIRILNLAIGKRTRSNAISSADFMNNIDEDVSHPCKTWV